jgi:hypothetical protein
VGGLTVSIVRRLAPLVESGKGRARDAGRVAASWVSASLKHPLAKRLVLAWLIVQSVLTPFLVWKTSIEPSRREGLHEEPKVIVRVDEQGRCYAVNRGTQALAQVELRRYLHAFDPKEGCKEAAGFTRKGDPPEYLALLAAGQTISERNAPKTTPASDLFECGRSSISCTALVECQATFSRTADLKQFERISFAGLSPGGKVEYPIIDIRGTSPQHGGGETYTIIVKSEWKRAVDCAQKKRAFRKAMDEFAERYVTGVDSVTPSN